MPLIANPHVWALYFAVGGAVFLFTLLGVILGMRTWRQHRKRYEDGASETLDALYINMPAHNLLYLGVFGALGGMLVGWGLSGLPWVGLVAAVLGCLAPGVGLRLLKRRREAMFQMQLVDALVHISNGMRAGFSLPQALELLSRESPAPMSQEMRLVSQEVRLGVPVEEALARLLKRMPSVDLDLVVTAVDIVRDVGGNLTEVFDNIAQTIRERHRIEGKIRALTAQGRMQSWVMAAIPVALGLLMNLIAPQIFGRLFQTTAGWAMIGVVVVLTLAGMLWIRWIVKIDV